MRCSNCCSSVSFGPCSSCSSYILLLVVVVPLILISGFLCLIGSNTSSSLSSTWVSLSNYSTWVSTTTHPGISSAPPPSSASFSVPTITKERDNQNQIDFSTEVQKEAHQLHIAEESPPEAFAFNNISPSPQKTIEFHQPDQIIKQEEGLKTSSMNISDFDPDRARRVIKQTTKLQKLESRLAKARAAIREAAKNGNNQIPDPDYVPAGPMYWNSHAFHRSYLEMEKQFKIFIYEEGEPPLFHSGPCKSIYSIEGNFIHQMEMEHRFRTRDPNKAHVYFLPFSVVMMVRFVYVPNSHDHRPISKTVIDYVNVIRTKYLFWNRSLGADHFMLSCHDWGPGTSKSVPYLYKNSIRALCNANTSEGFVPSKDLSIPEINLKTGDIKGWVGGPSPSHRPILAFFAGGLHGPIRPILFLHWMNKDEDIKVYQYLPKHISYQDMMKKSKYCICPSGYEVASPRIVEAFYAGCVPVLISDHYVPPFSDVLNWKSFSVEVPVSEVPNLKKILMGISQRQYIKMQRRGLKVLKHFEVNSPPKRFDVFHMILHSIWLRRLNVQIHGDK